MRRILARRVVTNGMVVAGAACALACGFTRGAHQMIRPIAAVVATVLLAGCATTSQGTSDASTAGSVKPRFLDDPYASTYQRVASPPVLIAGATVLTGTGTRLDNADVLLRDGRIVA